MQKSQIERLCNITFILHKVLNHNILNIDQRISVILSKNLYIIKCLIKNVCNTWLFKLYSFVGLSVYQDMPGLRGSYREAPNDLDVVRYEHIWYIIIVVNNTQHIDISAKFIDIHVYNFRRLFHPFWHVSDHCDLDLWSKVNQFQ